MNQKVNSATQSQKVDAVRSVFSDTGRYLNRRAFDIQIRAETVKEWDRPAGDLRILDIGCGDGSLSLPLLNARTSLTLLDISSNMLAIAESKIPFEHRSNVELIKSDFMIAQFQPRSFDLILCVGVLAHVASLPDFLGKIMSLLKASGTLIVECTEARHFVSKIDRAWGYLRPGKYALNAVSYSEVVKILEDYNMQPKATFRYMGPLPAAHFLVPQKLMYRLTRYAFGRLGKNRNMWLGNEYISFFSRA